MSKIKFEITDDFSIFVSYRDSNGLYTKKFIDVDTLYELLDSSKGRVTRDKKISKEKRNILYSSPIMSSFNGVHILQHIIKNDNVEIIVLQREARPSRVAFYDEFMDNVGMPSLVFAIYLNNKKIITAKVMAVKDKIIKEDTIMCAYPLTNVSDTGSICFGGNKLSDIPADNVYELLSFPNMFLSMPCTHEIRYQNHYGMELRPLLNYLKGKEFDPEKLKETKLTYKDWIQRYVE